MTCLEVFTYPSGQSTPLVDLDMPDTSYILFEIMERETQPRTTRSQNQGNARNNNGDSDLCGYHVLILPPNQDMKLVPTKHGDLI